MRERLDVRVCERHQYVYVIHIHLYIMFVNTEGDKDPQFVFVCVRACSDLSMV